MKTVFIDIDGTLRDHILGVPESAVKALNLLRAKGNSAVICTGRTKGMIPTDVPMELFDGIVAGGGCFVSHGGTIYRDRYIPDKVIKELICFFTENNIPYNAETMNKVFLTQSMSDNLFAIKKKRLSIADSEAARLAEAGETVKEGGNMDIFLASPLPTSKMCFIATTEQYEQIKKNIRPELEMLCYDVYNSTFGDGLLHCEFVSKGCNKGSGIREYCRVTGTDIRDTVGFGDSMNDAEMFNTVGLSVCMGDAPEGVQKIADRTCPKIMEDGLLRGFVEAGLI